jgi:hypothetical protein
MDYKRFFIDFAIVMAIFAGMFVGWEKAPVAILLLGALVATFFIVRIMVRSWKALFAKPGERET